MVRTRIILFIVSALVVWGLFLLPKAVVENDNQLGSAKSSDSSATTAQPNPHGTPSAALQGRIKDLRTRYLSGSNKEKNAIFADSLADLYQEAGQFDSAAWFAEDASTFFNSTKSFLKAGNNYYEAFSFSVNSEKQRAFAVKAQLFFTRVMQVDPGNLDVKTKMAMTYVSTSTPMKGIQLLREVLAQDPKNQPALFNLGMLSIQSGQYDRAIERLLLLTEINPAHIQGQLLLGMAYMNKGDKAKAKQQFEKVKQLDSDPSVQATADSYLKELK